MIEESRRPERLDACSKMPVPNSGYLANASTLGIPDCHISQHQSGRCIIEKRSVGLRRLTARNPLRTSLSRIDVTAVSAV